MACGLGQVAIVKYLLSQKKLDVNIKCSEVCDFFCIGFWIEYLFLNFPARATFHLNSFISCLLIWRPLQTALCAAVAQGETDIVNLLFEDARIQVTHSLVFFFPF